MKYENRDNDLVLTETECFNVGLSVDCGQSFRWTQNENGVFHAVVKGKAVDIEQNENEVVFKNTTKEDFEKLWISYFDLETDYKSICDSFNDEYLQKACSEYSGIRILHQEPWETVCSFIISQNNNIPRIKGIISRLCESFGEKINDADYTFPSYDVIAGLNENDLAPLRAGFRNKYILDAARKFSSGEVSAEKIEKLSIEEARNELMKIKGVGAKVAECSLLYGFGRKEAFPVDVWVKRIMAELYPNGLPSCTKGVEGIAQQYLFHWRRNLDKSL